MMFRISRNLFLAAALSSVLPQGADALVPGAYTGTSAPLNAQLGQVWNDMSTAPPTQRTFDGSQWVAQGTLDASTHRFVYSGAPIAPAQGGCGVAGLSGLLKGNGTNPCTAAIVGTDFLAPNGSGAALTGIPFANLAGAATGAQLAFDAVPACQSLTAFGGKADGTTDNLPSWNAAVAALSIRTSICIALPAGVSMFSNPATVTLSGSQTLTVRGAGMNTTEAWFPNSGNGFAITYPATGLGAYAIGSSASLEDLAVTTSQTTASGTAWLINGNSTVGVTMKPSNVHNVASRGHDAASYWSKDLDFENVQNGHVSNVFLNGCAPCGQAATGANSGGTAITYNSAGTGSRATQFQMTDVFVGGKALGVNVLGSPQGVTLTNANLSGVYNGVTFNLSPAEAVCNLSNVQINAANQAINITNCLQGAITQGTFYQGLFGTPSGNGISELLCVNCHYMTIVGNNFQGGTAGGFTSNGVLLALGSGNSDSNVVASNVFSGTATSIILGTGTTNTIAAFNISQTGASLSDGSGNTSNTLYDATTIKSGALSQGAGQITEGRLGAAGNPTFVSCGTAPSFSATSNDTHGTFTTGSGATACTFNWHTTRGATPDCIITPTAGGAQPAGGCSNGGLSVTVAASTKYTYSAFGQ